MTNLERAIRCGFLASRLRALGHDGLAGLMERCAAVFDLGLRGAGA